MSFLIADRVSGAEGLRFLGYVWVRLLIRACAILLLILDCWNQEYTGPDLDLADAAPLPKLRMHRPHLLGASVWCPSRTLLAPSSNCMAGQTDALHAHSTQPQQNLIQDGLLARTLDHELDVTCLVRFNPRPSKHTTPSNQ